VVTFGQLELRRHAIKAGAAHGGWFSSNSDSHISLVGNIDPKLRESAYEPREVVIPRDALGYSNESTEILQRALVQLAGGIVDRSPCRLVSRMALRLPKKEREDICQPEDGEPVAARIYGRPIMALKQQGGLSAIVGARR
jgi:hypothetical protein